MRLLRLRPNYNSNSNDNDCNIFKILNNVIIHVVFVDLHSGSLDSISPLILLRFGMISCQVLLKRMSIQTYILCPE